MTPHATSGTTPHPVPYATWGPPAKTPSLSRAAQRFLDAEVGPLAKRRAVGLDEAAARVPRTRLTKAARAALAEAVGGENVHIDPATRAGRAGGQSYLDVLRRRVGDVSGAPDAVIRPESHEQVAAVFAASADHRVAIVPVGGGTSVVGGVSAGEQASSRFSAVVAMEMSRMSRVLEVDADSMTATVEPGIRGPELERVLAADGLTLGHLPQSFERASIGGYVATRSAGQASTGYGRMDDLVVALRVATPVGDLRLGRGPASAAGPDLLHLVVGSEGTLGVLTAVTLRVRHAPVVRRYEAWVIGSFDAGLTAFRELAQHRSGPDVARLSDPDETRAALALTGPSGVAGTVTRRVVAWRGGGTPCIAVLGWEGGQDDVRLRRRLSRRALRRAGGRPLGRRGGESWRRHRFDGPYLRDALLDHGVCVETVETAATWSALRVTYDAVCSALTASLAGRGTPPLVGAHVSHLYETGASLYFTVLARQQPGQEAEQWSTAKRAASEAIVSTGATITHHHAVGRDHRPYLEAEIGPVGVATLRAVKKTLDPDGLLNPGVLIPAEQAEG